MTERFEITCIVTGRKNLQLVEEVCTGTADNFHWKMIVANGHMPAAPKLRTNAQELDYVAPKAAVIVAYMKETKKKEYALEELMQLGPKMHPPMKPTSVSSIISVAAKLNLVKRTRKGHYGLI